MTFLVIVLVVIGLFRGLHTLKSIIRFISRFFKNG